MSGPPIAARHAYAKRPAPTAYDAGYLNLELGNIQRAIPQATARTVTSATTVTAVDDLILADATTAAVSVALPPAARVQGLRVTIKRINSGAHAVTITGTVDGTLNPTLASQWSALTVQSDGTMWLKLGSV